MDRCCARRCGGVSRSDVLPSHCPPTIRKARFAKPVKAYRFSARMHSQAMHTGDMYSVTRASFLDEAPVLEDFVYDDVAPLSRRR